MQKNRTSAPCLKTLTLLSPQLRFHPPTHIHFILFERRCFSPMGSQSPRISQLQRHNFCRYYLLLGNPCEAALAAGFPPDSAAEDALALLQTPSCRSYLSQLAAKPALPMQTLVLTGLSRLAFGSAKDIVKLAFAEDLPSQEQLDALDLFQISELKRVKGGGIEIKLFDRQKALEKLLECASAADSSAAAAALLSALSVPSEEANDLDDLDPAPLFRQAEKSAELVDAARHQTL